MKVKSVIKVMNFHSLLRVDSAKRKAEKYSKYELLVRDFMNNILNNKNLILDKKMIIMNENGIDLNIYIGNDYGFCGNFNSNINELLREDIENDKIVIGKKIIKKDLYPNVVASFTKEEYLEQTNLVNKIMFEAISDSKYKSINLIYNHYYNINKIERVKEKILPLEKFEINEKDYNEDFVIEGNVNSILTNLTVLYLSYEVKVALENSYASENIMRQMITKESLKKIDEIEEEKKTKDRKERNMKNLKKQLDNINNMNLSS